MICVPFASISNQWQQLSCQRRTSPDRRDIGALFWISLPLCTREPHGRR